MQFLQKGCSFRVIDQLTIRPGFSVLPVIADPMTRGI